MTLAQLVAEVDAIPSVMVAYLHKPATKIDNTGEPGLHHAWIYWYYLSGGIAQQGGGEVIIENSGAQGEAAYWYKQTPSILVPAVAPTFITARTVPFTLAQVESFCNTQWRATPNNTNALAIIEFAASNVTGNTVRVSGLFHDVATNTRPRHTFLITLVDANGATSGANVKFERVVE